MNFFKTHLDGSNHASICPQSVRRNQRDFAIRVVELKVSGDLAEGFRPLAGWPLLRFKTKGIPNAAAFERLGVTSGEALRQVVPT